MRLGAGPRARRPVASGPDELRRANLSAVLRMLHVHGAATRSDLVAATGFNRSTVGALTSELGRLGLVRERPGVVRGKGRPSLVVEPVAAAVHVLAVDVTQSSVGAAVVGLGGYLLQLRRRLHDTSAQDVAGVVASVAAMVAQMHARAASPSVCLGLVASVPGSVRQPDGLVRRSPSLHWSEVPFAELLAGATAGAYPVTVGNDGDLGVVAEHLRGAARGCRDVLYVRGEAGVGGGVVVDGDLLKGAGGYAGEVGHIVVRPDGRVCSCGARGCWEAEVGDAAIIRAAGRDPRESDIEDVLSDVAVGNRRAVAGVRRTGQWVGTGLATLANLFNPEVVVLGGSLGALYPTMEPALAETFARALGPVREHVRLVRSELGSDAQLVGAAEVGFADLLEDPAGTLGPRAPRAPYAFPAAEPVA